MAAFIAFAFIDPFLVTDSVNLTRIRWIRVVIIMALIGTWAMARQGPASRWTHMSGHTCCLVIGLGVSLVTVMCGGGDSRYHDALAVTFWGYATFVPSTFKQGTVIFSCLIAFHVCLQIFTGTMGTNANFWTNFSILTLAAVLSTAWIFMSNIMKSKEVSSARDKTLMIDKLTMMDTAKNAFFANVSHELRTPLMLIIASIDSVQEQNLGDLKIGQQIQIGRRNGLRLLRLVDDLLELSKLESDTVKLRYSAFDIGAFVEELAAQTRALAERKGISVVVNMAACGLLTADHHQIERVVLNLMANAIKFTGVGGIVTASLCAQEDGVRVEISDTGEGIASDALPRIFERFYQANPTTKAKRGGVGIGLSLCKHIVELHGGRIDVRSQVGRGTTVGFWIPLRSATAAQEIGADDAESHAIKAVGSAATALPKSFGHASDTSVQASEANKSKDMERAIGTHRRGQDAEIVVAGLARDAVETRQGNDRPAVNGGAAGEKGMPEWDQALRERADYRFFGIEEVSDRRAMPRSEIKNDGPPILVVDDNRDMVDFMLSILGADHQVWAAADGEEGLRLARRHRPELIVSDLMMPNMSGLDLLREVRADPNLATKPFVLLTARGQDSDRRESDEAQADAFLPKPFFAGDLRPIVSRLLKKQDGQASELQDANVLSLRMMAAGIAHDILNPVGFIKQSLTIVRENFLEAVAWGDPQTQPVKEVRGYGTDFLDTAEEGVERVIAAVGELRRFARGEVSGDLKPTDVADCVKRIVAMTRPHGIFTTTLKAQQRPMVRHGQLEQVLLNLVLNALQAGGNNCKIDIGSQDDVARQMVQVTVRDGGPGMDASTLSKIFDPYFTTKKTGTGLGLTMCRQIIRDHGGRLEVDSQPGRGTSFTITLPFQAEPQETPDASARPQL